MHLIDLDLIATAQDACYVQVTVISGLAKPLTYRVPASMSQKVSVGCLVRVPLRNRSELGIVRSIGGEDIVDPDLSPLKIKPIEGVMYSEPVFTKDLINLFDWMQKYYAASPESVLETMIPAPLRRGLGHKEENFFEVSKILNEEEFLTLQKKSKKQAAVYELLVARSEPFSKKEICDKVKVTPSVIDALVEKEILAENTQIVQRQAYQDHFAKTELHWAQQTVVLNDEQEQAYQDISLSTESKKFQVHLLHGITGSGKTEVYLKLIEKIVAEGGSVLFLVPEVALTPQTVGKLQARLSHLTSQSVVWHSMLSEGERFDAWMSIIRGNTRIVVGARSAVFAPVHNLKLVIIDEEHEPAYKQEDSPRYHGRDVAVYRAMLNHCVCVLGSATPSLESLYNVEIKGYKLNKLTKRIDDRQLPMVHIVDMKQEMLAQQAKKASRNGLFFSRMLVDKMIDRLEKKEQTILFLNRRGFSSSMQCMVCGHVEICDHCSVALTYHRADEKLRCHVCDAQKPAPERCPKCQAHEIRWRGFGTQRVEEHLKKIMPQARIVRMDTDAMSKKNMFRQILSDFRVGKIDILIGTQMIAKGLDFPNVTLVGMIDADISLYVPDFRASERTFQLLVQVAGRAGRGDRAGEVVVQTFTPEGAPIQFSRRADFEGFLLTELQHRKEFLYPPYRHIVRHIFRSLDEKKVRAVIESWASMLEAQCPKGLEIRGPAPAPLSKERGYYRYHLWYFMGNVSKIVPSITELREKFLKNKDVIDVLDVDPMEMS